MGKIPRALTVAGSDSGGCAGIQADLKTFAALGVHGMSAVSCVTAQNTRRVFEVVLLPPKFVELQISAVAEDIGVDAVKTGMLPTAQIIEAVARQIRRLGIGPVVVDPVMVSTAGDPLIEPEAVQALRRSLFPLACLVTPNLREAAALAGFPIESRKEAEAAARLIHSWGPGAVLVKGGHSGDPSRSVDLLYDGSSVLELDAPRIDTQNTHGSGCTLASAIAAFLARGLELREAANQAKEYVTRAIEASFPLGAGCGPLGHFWNSWESLSGRSA